MDILSWVKSLFAGEGPLDPPSPRGLNARSEAALAASIEDLRPGERSWITSEEGGRCSRRWMMNMRSANWTSLANSISGPLQRPTVPILGPFEGRIYFTRRAN
jgi:hypothetical protein